MNTQKTAQDPWDVETGPVDRVHTRELPKVTAAGPVRHAAPPQPVRPVAPAPKRSGNRAGIVAAVVVALVAGVAVGVASVGVPFHLSRVGLGSSASSGSPVTVEAVSSVDPSGGSGFLPTADGGWRTQRYRSAEFGNLKDGVGLLLDLGQATSVKTVTLHTSTPGIDLDLRSGSSAHGAPGSFTETDSVKAAGSSATLSGTGSARYWLVWVTGLAPDGGGYRAVVDSLTVQA